MKFALLWISSAFLILFIHTKCGRGVFLPQDFSTKGTLAPDDPEVVGKNWYYYVSGHMSDQIERYEFDPVLGTSSFLGATSTLQGPHGITKSPDSMFLAVPNVTGTGAMDGYVEIFSVDAASGDLTSVAGNDAEATTADGFQAVFHPDGDYLYTTHRASGHVAMYHFDKDTGMISNEATWSSVAINVEDIDMRPDGTHLYVTAHTADDIEEIIIDAMGDIMGGDAAVLTQAESNSAIDHDGDYLYLGRTADIKVINISGNTLDDAPADESPTDDYRALAYHPTLDVLYGGNDTNNTLDWMPTAAGIISSVNATPTLNIGSPVGRPIRFSPDGKFLFMVYNDPAIAIYSINQTTGEPTHLATESLQSIVDPWGIEVVVLEDP